MTDDEDVPPLEDIPSLPTTTAKKQIATPVVKYVQAEPEERQEKQKSFGGMKKGFLSSGATSKSNELVEISRRIPGTEKDFRILDEVQQVIKEEQQAKDSWLTDDLLKQIEHDESLSKHFSDPYFMEAITLFQKKPQEALAKYGHNAEVMQFFNRMATILGSHLSSIAATEEKQKLPKVDPEVNKLLQDEHVRQLLLDPDVVQLMKMLREQPDKAQWIMRTANATMRDKVRRLVQLGLLSLA